MYGTLSLSMSTDTLAMHFAATYVTPVTGAAARPTATESLGTSTTANSYGLDDPNALLWPSRMTTSATSSTSAKRQRA